MEWSDIRVFLQVARLGQMAGASPLLGLDHSTISRRIARLEESMGVTLFDRAGRRLNLTVEGRRMLAAAERLEAVVLQDVLPIGEARQEIGGRVRIGTSEGFGSHYLAQRLPLLLERHPGLEIELVSVQRSHSLAMREVDVVIGPERPDTGDVRLRRLCDAPLRIYARNDYFDGRPTPESVEDLRDDLWCGYIEELLFTEVLDMMTFGATTVVPRYRTTSVTAQLGAALGGRALVVLPTYMAASFPALSPVLSDRVQIELTYWMSVHNDLARSSRVRAVMDGIEELVQGDRGLFAAPP